MKSKRKYEKPAMQAFELKQQPRLLAGSDEVMTSATGGFEDYQDGIFEW